MIAGNVWRAHARVVVANPSRCRHAPLHSLPTRRLPFLPPKRVGGWHTRRRFAGATNSGNAAGDDREWLPPDDSPLASAVASQEPHRDPAGDAGGDDREWLPPDGSPLAAAAASQEPRRDPARDAPGDEVITVVDLEKTLNHPSNRHLLNERPEGPPEASAVDFEVTSSNVGLEEVLRELKEAGETEMLGQLVEEYNLGSQLEALEDEAGPGGDKDKDTTADKIDKDEEWDDDFEESVRGLSQEEIIDELIERSPALSQLEMEVVADALEQAERAGDVDVDDDALELPAGLYESAAVREFRAMVWEDYDAKKRKETRASPAATTTTNWATKEDLSAYPPDWGDYDANDAFRRDFLEGGAAQAPPSSELILSRSRVAVGEGVANPPENAAMPPADLDDDVDWLQARRARRGDAAGENNKTPTRLLTPKQADELSHRNSRIPVKPHTPFTTDELSASLVAQGGTDVRVIATADAATTCGVGIGCDALLLVTGRTAAHVRVLADSVVRNMRERGLSDRGVEGGRDMFSTRRGRHRARRKGATHTSRKIDDDWIAVDCGSVHVHVMEAVTRKCLNIESLWDFDDPNSEGSKLRRVDCSNEDDVDTYVAENPIPDEYAAKMLGREGGGGWITGGSGRVQTIPAFPKKSFGERWGSKRKDGRNAR